MYGIYEEAGTSNPRFRGGSGFFSGELLDYLESVSAGYLIRVKLKNLIGLLEGQKWEEVEGNAGWEQADPHFHEDKFYVSMCHRELCKTVCGSKEIDQTCPCENGDREGIVSYTRV